jgi:regulator of sigma E protease
MTETLAEGSFLSSLLAFVLVLIPAVIIHELGHLLAAKAVGITILEFGIGYPPRAFRMFRWGETDFTFNWIPLGGFVRPFGEDMIKPQNETEIEEERAKVQQARAGEAPQGYSDAERLARLGITHPKTVNDVRPLGRIFFMAAGAIANVVGALVLFVLIGLSGVQDTSASTIVVVQIEPGSALAQAGVQAGDIVEAVNGRNFADQSEFLALLNAGETVTLDLVSVVDDAVERRQVQTAAGAGGVDVSTQLVVMGYQLDSPAEKAGIQQGDILLSADGQSLARDGFETLRQINQNNQGRTYTLKVLRDGETLSLNITPRVNPGALGYLGATVQVIYASDALGMSFVNGQPILRYTPLGLGEAVQYGFGEVGFALQTIAQMPARLLSGEASPEESRVVSIVGISQLGGVLLEGSFDGGSLYPFLRFAALISIALGITNLLPIPPLDGGRILFVLIEVLRGKPLSQRVEEAVMITGLLLMLILGIVVIINDIRNPIIDLLR